MTDWTTCQADYTYLMGTHYTKGRGGSAIRQVVVHETAGTYGPTNTDQVRLKGPYNVWQTRAASANWGVCGTHTAQYVSDTDTAWANGTENSISVSIEHVNESLNPQTVSGETWDTGTHLVAALCVFYELGRPVAGSNLKYHGMLQATSCPVYIRTRWAEYVADCQAWYDTMKGTDMPLTSDDVEKVWGRKITHGTSPAKPAIQELADARTYALEASKRLEKVEAALEVIKAKLGV